MRSLVALTGLLFAGMSAAATLDAQRPQLEITLPPAGAMQEGPSVATGNLLADARTRELLRHGLPTQIHYRLELWRKGWPFDDPTGKVEWDVLVQYDPLAQVFNVVRRMGTQLQESFVGTATVTTAELQFGKAFRVPLSPSRSGRYYYNLAVDVQTLTESDLDALQEWLRGPTAPGKGNPIDAIRSGVGTLLSRVLGNKDHYEQKSADFSAP